MQKLLRAVWKLTLALAVLNPSTAAVAEIQTKIVQPVSDLYIQEGGTADQNFGGSSQLIVGGGNPRARALLRFQGFEPDAPEGSIVSVASAFVEVVVSSSSGWSNGFGGNVSIHRMTDNWSETGTTWNCDDDPLPGNGVQDCEQTWDGATGTFVSTPSDIQATSVEDSVIRLSVTQDIEAILAGELPYGWLIKLTDETDPGRLTLGSRELEGSEPRLVVNYDVSGDSNPPVIELTEPIAGGFEIRGPRPDLTFLIRDGGSGLAGDLAILLDGVDITSLCVASQPPPPPGGGGGDGDGEGEGEGEGLTTGTGERELLEAIKLSNQAGAGTAPVGEEIQTCTPDSDLAAGVHTVQVSVSDLAGNLGTFDALFDLLLGKGPHVRTLTANADTFLLAESDLENRGDASTLEVQDTPIHRSLVDFDLAGFQDLVSKTTVTVDGAVLELFVEGVDDLPSARTVAPFRLTADWFENEATWSCARDLSGEGECGSPWTGGSLAASAESTATVDGTTSGLVSWTVTSDLSGGLLPAESPLHPLHGWALRFDPETGTPISETPPRITFTSREGLAAQAPRLVITFSTPDVTDSVAPLVVFNAPGATTTDTTPAVSLTFSDDDSGVDPATFVLTIDGNAMTGNCTVQATGAECVSPLLAAGTHTLVATLADLAGNSGQTTHVFEVTATGPPTIQILQPGASVLNDATPDLEVAFSDADGDFDPSSVRVILDGVHRTEDCLVDATGAQCVSPILDEGSHRLLVIAGDLEGNEAVAELVFNLSFDSTFPDLAITSPSTHFVLDPQPTIQLTHEGTGLAPGTLQVLVDGVDVTASCQIQDTSSLCFLPSPLAEGLHVIQASVSNISNNTRTVERRFDVLPGDGAYTRILTAVADTSIGPASRGTATTVRVQPSPDLPTRTLVRFDTSAFDALAADASLEFEDIVLRLTVADLENFDENGMTLNLFPLDRAWNETEATQQCPTDEDPATAGSQCAVPWNGGSFGAQVASFVLPFAGTRADFDLGATGFNADGWIVRDSLEFISEEPSLPSVLFASREHGGLDPPELHVSFVLGNSPDFDPPTLNIIAPGPVVVNEATPDIELTYSDAQSGVDVSSLVVSVDGVDITAECSASAPGESACSVPFALAAGFHLIEVQIADLAGNVATAELDFEVIFDATPPVITVVAPPAIVYNDTQPAIEVTYSDDSAVDTTTLEIELDGSDLLASCTVTPTGATCTPPTLAAGSHTLRVFIEDRIGRATEEIYPFEIVLDTTAPSLGITAPTGTVYNDTTPAVTVTFSDDNAGIDATTLDVLVDSVSILGSCVVDEVAGTAVCEPGELTAGTHAIDASLADLAGNVATANAGFDLAFDTTPPALDITAPIGTVTGDSTPAVTVTFSDTESGVDATTLKVRVDGFDITTSCVLGSGTATCEPPALGEGDHTTTAEIADLAGNLATDSQPFTVDLDLTDTVAPSLAITSPSAPVVDDPAPVIVVTYSDAETDVDLTTLRIAIDGFELVTDGRCVVGAASATCTPPLLGAGTHGVTADIADLAGNPATASASFDLSFTTADAVAPVVTITEPTETTIFDDLTPQITVTYSDADSGVAILTLAVDVDGTDITAGCVVGDTSAVCEPPPLTVGSHVVTAAVEDLHGNPGSASFGFDIALTTPDTTPPVIAIAEPSTTPIDVDVTPIRVTYADGETGVDLSSLTITLDASDITATCDVGPTEATCTSPTLAEGSHTVAASIQDLAGNSASASFTFDVVLVVDTTPPQIVIVEPPNRVYNDTAPTIRVEYSDADSTVDTASLDVRVDGASILAGCTVGADAADCIPSPLTLGSHVLEAQVTDTAGNTGFTTRTIEIVEDTAPPSVTIQSPEPTVVNDANPLIQASYQDAVSGIDIETVDVLMDGQSILGSCSPGFSSVTCTSPTLTAGTHLVEVRVSDGAGNPGTGSLSFELILDSAAPVVGITAPPGLVVDDPTPQVVVTFSDSGTGVDVGTLQVLVNSGDITATCTLNAGTATCESNPLNTGSHRVTARISDQVGNEGEASQVFDLQLEEEPPSVSIDSPAPGATVTTSTPTFAISYSDDGSGIDTTTLQVKIDGLDITSGCTVDPSSASCVSPPIGDGEHTVEAVIEDLLGNSATASVTFTVSLDLEDTVPPVVSIEPLSGSTVTDDSTPSITVSYSDADSGVDTTTLAVDVDGQDLTEQCLIGSSSATCEPLPLTAGFHTVTATIADLLGNETTEQSTFEVVYTVSDTEGPVLVVSQPAVDPVVDNSTPQIQVDFSDAGVGVDLLSLTVTIDGQDLLPSCQVTAASALCQPSPLAAGSHTVAAQMSDLVGNPGSVSSTFDVVLTIPDTTPPSLVIVAPSEASVEEGTAVPVVLEFDDSDSGIDLNSLAVDLNGADLTGTCIASATGATCTDLSLAPGLFTLNASVSDLLGNAASASFAFEVVADTRPPFVRILTPDGGLVVGDATPEIRVELEDVGSGIDEASLQILLDSVDLTAGCEVDLPASTAVCEPSPLSPGEHVLQITVADLRGNQATSTRVFDLELRLAIQIETPAAGFLTVDATVDVTGTVSPEAETVAVHGIDGVVSDGAFVVSGVDLHEGTNTLTAVARTTEGGVGSATVAVVRDTTAPTVVIQSPPDGFVTTASQILVTGEYNDPASSGTDFAEATVTINGVPAGVEQRTFVLEDHLLQPGENTIRVEVADAVGNVGIAEVAVTLLTNPVQKIEELLGNGQTGTVGATLSKPLVVRVTDGIGNPLEERLVTFQVSRGDGFVSTAGEEDRSITVRTDSLGRAQVDFILGERSGRGNHEVAVTSAGFPGSLVFCASAEPMPAHRIVRVQGNIQTGTLVGAVGEELPKPLYTQVFDAMKNPVEGVPVTFEVVTGGGSFGGTPTFTTETDANGVATATFTLGPDAGFDVHVVKATIPNGTGGPAVFNITGLEPGPEALTSISGLVLDNQDLPVPDATVSVRDTTLTAITDAEGRFQIAGAPVGTVHLVADGTTTTLAGTWPVLEFEMVTVSGRDNELGMPIRMLPMDPGVLVGGDVDVEIPLEGVPGASLTVFANSVTFPDGSTEGLVSFTQVHNDKVPMVPPLGSMFAVALTIQPPGTLFDPPAQIQIPNPGHKPGEVVDIFSFDHDLGEFVSAGTGSVTPDGQFLRSNPGFGVRKAGWHGCSQPLPDTDVCGDGGNAACTVCTQDGPQPRCGECENCNGGSAIVAGGEGGPFNIAAAQGSTCTPKTVTSVQITSRGEPDRVIVAKDEDVPFNASIQGSCGNLEYEWNFGDGSPAEMGGASTSHTYTDAGVKTVQVTVTCKGCSGAGSATDTIEVVVVEVTVDSLSPSTELVLGEDLTVNYTINAPPDVTFDRVELRILNQSDDEIFRTANLPVQSGSQQGTWEKGKWNQSPHVGAFANPNGGDYKVVVAAFKGNSEAKSEDDKTIRTKLVIEATIEDKPAQGSSASVSAGLRDLSQILKVVFKNGSSETAFSGGSIMVMPQGTDDSVKDIKIEDPGLNSLSDADYKVLFRDLRDDIGNFSDDDNNDQNGIQPLEFEIELRSAP